MAKWHTTQEEDARQRVSDLINRDDLTNEQKQRCVKRWADIADWHESRAKVWRKKL